MTTIRSLALLAVTSSGLLFGGSLYAAPDHHAAGTESAAPASNDWLAKQKAAYPLDTCVVSGDKLDGGSMGAPIDYVYKEDGKPDRLVRFCCKSCIKDFKKEPAKYLKTIDDAATAKKSGPEHHHHDM